MQSTHRSVAENETDSQISDKLMTEFSSAAKLLLGLINVRTT